MLHGTIKWFNYEKGYGFITPDAGEKDVFVHITALQKAHIEAVIPGQKVKFSTYDDRGRTAAYISEIE